MDKENAKKMVVFTNGCFDILHVGHIDLLNKAKALGDRLIVGLNSDESIRQIKGNNRPIIPEAQRYIMLRNLRMVDSVILFDEPDPLILIKKVNPDILVKGGDWGPDEIIGSDFVKSNGGSVVRIPLVEGISTTNIVNKIKNYYKNHFLNLLSLAIMNRDGGHYYTEEHGMDKAVEDAKKVYYDLRSERGE